MSAIVPLGLGGALVTLGLAESAAVAPGTACVSLSAPAAAVTAIAPSASCYVRQTYATAAVTTSVLDCP